MMNLIHGVEGSLGEWERKEIAALVTGEQKSCVVLRPC